jgi:hypothetical protein
MSTDRPSTTAARIIGAGSVIVGVALLAAPGRVCDLVSNTGARPTGWVRLLGARYLAQGVAQLRWPRPAVLRGSAAVDGLHAVSMVALAAASPTYRRLAVCSAALASAGTAANASTALGACRSRR